MATVNATDLFPPILPNYYSAKIITEVNDGLKIGFDINNLNDITTIQSIHVMITRQTNYHSLFTNDYLLGIYVIDVPWEDVPEGETPLIPDILQDKEITVPLSIIDYMGQLDFNEYYKVQLRFSKNKAGVGLTGAELSTALLSEANMGQFSEWSRVGALRFIAPIQDEDLILKGNTDNEQIVLIPSVNNIAHHYFNFIFNYIKQSSCTVGTQQKKKTFKAADDKEYLSSWQIKLYCTDDGQEELVESTPEHEMNYRGGKMNQFIYDSTTYLQTNNSGNPSYKGVLTLTTANGYVKNIQFFILCTAQESSWSQQSDLNEYTSLDSVIGKVNISFETKNKTEGYELAGPFDLTIRRASVDDDFTKWETIWKKSYDESYRLPAGTPIVFDDFTIESGTIYKYAIEYDKNGEIYEIIEGPVLSIFDHAFLTGEGTQLCVKFNPNISNMKVNVSDNITNTIGGQYPYITRNGNMYYRTFSLSGTIAYEMDAEHQFATRSSIYGEWINVYGSYFVNRYINQRNDRLTQRKFRELVMSYLYDDMPKLFRSTPEGNILVRLTDVSLTPNQQLGRMIYDFSCTATEIGDCSIENYKLYKIQDFGDM